MAATSIGSGTGTGATYGVSGYNGVNEGDFDRQAADLQYRFNTDSATNAYGRFLSQSRGQRTLDDTTQSFQRGLPSAYASYNNRGLAGPGISSGTQQRAMTNYLGDYATDYGRQQQDLTQTLQNADLTQLNTQQYYNDSLAALQVQKQNAIANAALGIESLRPYLGGT